MQKSKQKFHTEAGFTLLEVIIAMAILTMALVPLYAVFGGYLDAIKKTGNENDKVQAKSQIIAFMEGINPDTQKSGTYEFPSYTLSWEATPILGPFENTQDQMGKGNFTLNLYDTKITASNPNQDIWFEFTFRQVGYTKKTKNMSTQEAPGAKQPEEQRLPRTITGDKN